MRKLALFVLLVVAAIGFWRWHAQDAERSGNNDVATAPAKKDASLPVSAVLAVRPDAKGSASPRATASPRKPGAQASADVAQFRARQDYASLYARVKDLRTPEALYLRAALYARCGPNRTASMARDQQSAARARFVAEVSAQGSRATEQRIAAYDKLATNACADLDFGAFDAARLDVMIAAAAAAGDPRARAWQLADRIDGMKIDDKGQRYSSDANMPAGAIEEVQRLLSTGDPDIAMALSGTLASTMSNGLVEIDGTVVDPRGMNAALKLYACDVGGDCGADSFRILSACAYDGNCEATNLYDYIYYYDLSPSASQMTDSYRQRLEQMYATGDFSGLSFVPVPGSVTPTFRFRSRRP